MQQHGLSTAELGACHIPTSSQDLFNEAGPTPQVVETSAALVRKLDPTRPINALSGSSHEQQGLVQSDSDVQDLHTDGPPTFQGSLNASLVVMNSEAHRCGCLPPKEHMWFHAQSTKDACYSVTAGVDCNASSATYVSWATAHAADIQYTGLSATGYVQNRDMVSEGPFVRNWCFGRADLLRYVWATHSTWLMGSSCCFFFGLFALSSYLGGRVQWTDDLRCS